MAHHVRDIVDDLGVVVVEHHQRVVALERIRVPAAVGPLPKSEPLRRRALVTALLRLLESGKPRPTWLKTPSSTTRSPRSCAASHQDAQVILVAQSRVDAVVVLGVVAVAARCEHRPQHPPSTPSATE